jgi:hypothetical protein
MQVKPGEKKRKGTYHPRMKTKNISYLDKFKNFTGIFELCDGTLDKHNIQISYFENGFLHKKNNAAINFYDGTKYWVIHGQRHREDGPSYEISDGSKRWYLNDKQYPEEKWKDKIEMIQKNGFYIE